MSIRIIFILNFFILLGCSSHKETRYNKALEYSQRYFRDSIESNIPQEYRKYTALKIFDSIYSFNDYSFNYKKIKWKKNKYLDNREKEKKNWFSDKELRTFVYVKDKLKKPSHVLVFSDIEGDSLQVEILTCVDFYYYRIQSNSFYGERDKFLFVFKNRKIESINHKNIFY